MYTNQVIESHNCRDCFKPNEFVILKINKIIFKKVQFYLEYHLKTLQHHQTKSEII